MDFGSDNWGRVKQLFEAALELESSEWPAFLDKNCDNPALRHQIEHLLLNYKEAGSFLDEPVFESRKAPTKAMSKSTPEDLLRHNAEYKDALVTANSVQDPMAGRQFGAYRVIRQLGHGGMAVVYLAERADDEFRRQVAIKIVQPGSDSHDLINRFRNERQTLAGLDHPNIVKLFDGGSSDGLPFLVMDYVEGLPIDDYCDRGKLSVDERLQLFSKVCGAVQYAHQRGVVHRDIKPSNILVTAQGVPRLLDFGIAKVLNPEALAQSVLLTHTGVRCMTPAYASPEQIRGRSATGATDIYSLGVVLYELLCGHRPYRLTQHTSGEIERAICEQEAEAPSTAVSRVEIDTSSEGTPITKTPELVSLTREGEPDKLRRRLRGDLDNIVLKALQKDPSRRYGSAEELSEDIHRHLQHLPVKARRATLPYRASKLAMRYRIQMISGVAILVLVTAGALFTLHRLRILEAVQRGQHLSEIVPTNPGGWAVVGDLTLKSAVPCENLGALALPNTTIDLAQSVPAGTFTLSGRNLVQSLPAFCRVEGWVAPTKDSRIGFAVWMPLVGWNRKFRGVGNSGFGGDLNFFEMAAALRSGYATASTDTGHRGEEFETTWAIGHPERVADFGYRAVHEMTEKAKMVIRAFYGREPQLSFFEGLSSGGRQALIEAERFPQDYQGILAGASPVSVTHLLTAALYNTFAFPPAYIPASKIPAISAAVLAACDALDGVSDGILNDPRQCHFDPVVLRCRGEASDSCLTAPQIAELKKIYGGLRSSTGRELFPGYLPGGEDGDYGWELWISGHGPGDGLMPTFALNFFRGIVFENPAWDFRNLSAERAIEIADKKTARILNATDSDLRQFKAHGGKLILYHGWSDAAIPGTEIINYYNSVASKLGKEATQSFLRLYMVPGMHHAFLGPGPNSFGQVDLASLGSRVVGGVPMDPKHNISTALVQWAEKGIAPEAIVATKYLNDLDPTQGVKMTRPVCPYPQIAKYKGAGDTNNAANFVCVQGGGMLSP